MITKLLAMAITLTVVTNAYAADTSWRITKNSWSDADEKNYSAFVAAIGSANCNSFDSCLRSPANPYRASDPAGVTFFSDCADLPYMLRAYFAWKNGLPFSLVTGVSSADGQGKDIRYSPNGNLVNSRLDFTSKASGQHPDALRSLKGISDIISSAMFRFDPDLKPDSFTAGNEILGRLVPDFYSQRIDRNSVRPGSVMYDPNGHVAVVYAIESDGRVRLIDAHPDNSITHITYGEKFARSRPGMGSGFKNFRPLRLLGATRDASGNLIGGKIYFNHDKNIADFSTEQFYGMQRVAGSWSKGTFTTSDNQKVGYYEWVRARLANGNLKFHPVEEMRNMMTALCQDIKDRATSVEVAATAGINKKAQPAALPKNIYGTDGEWESFSTPSRDARLKTSFKELRDNVQSMVERYKARDPRIAYDGQNLKRDLQDAYAQEAAACTFSYTRSDGSAQTIGFEDVRARLFALSFDPYHCSERRWGSFIGAEASTCKDDANKTAWYVAEQRLRNQLLRSYDVPMGFGLSQLNAKAAGSGVDVPPDVNTKAYIDSINF
jgi:hypothetical protein